MSYISKFLAGGLAAGLALGVSGQSQGAEIPHLDNFDSYSVGTEAPGGWIVTKTISSQTGGATADSSIAVAERVASSGDLQYQSIVSGVLGGDGSSASNHGITASLSFPDVAGTDFVLKTDLYLEDFIGNAPTKVGVVGLGALGNNSNLGAETRYLLQWRPIDGAAEALGNEGQIRIEGSGITTTTSLDRIAPVAGRLYTMTLVGTYAESGALTMVGTLLDTVTEESISVNVTTGTSPLAGEYFGYRNAMFASSSTGVGDITLDVSFDNFSLVPEPAALGLLALGGLTMLRRRRVVQG